MIVIISQDSASDHVWSIEEIAGLLETRSNEILKRFSGGSVYASIKAVSKIDLESKPA